MNRFKQKYPFAAMEVGDCLLFAAENATERKRVQQAAINYGKRNGGAKFAFAERVPGWAECRRVA